MMGGSDQGPGRGRGLSTDPGHDEIARHGTLVSGVWRISCVFLPDQMNFGGLRSP